MKPVGCGGPLLLLLSSRLFVCFLPTSVTFFSLLLFPVPCYVPRYFLKDYLPRKWEEPLVEKKEKFVVAGFSSLILGLIVLATELGKRTT